MTQSTAPLVEEFQIGHPSLEWARAASEVGAAIVHQLNEPLTALLSDAAAALEDAVMLELAGGDLRNETDLALDGLISLTENGGTVSSIAEYVSHGA